MFTWGSIAYCEIFFLLSDRHGLTKSTKVNNEIWSEEWWIAACKGGLDFLQDKIKNSTVIFQGFWSVTKLWILADFINLGFDDYLKK